MGWALAVQGPSCQSTQSVLPWVGRAGTSAEHRRPLCGVLFLLVTFPHPPSHSALHTPPQATYLVYFCAPWL
ncbi:Uncharacterised protein [Chlamydia trachomatis]|nr:Uncharacterised protein [Chlamydia trachomatis]